MDRIEMERLMDKYKQEMIEFSRRNSLSDNLDSREKAQKNALENNIAYERSREDPLPVEETVSSSVSEEPSLAVAAVPDFVPQEENMEVTDVAAMLRSSCAGVASNPSSTQAQQTRCSEINKFLQQNPDSGSIRVEVFASDRAFGIGSARVMIFVSLPSGNVAVFDGLSDISGSTPSINLPAPSRELSQAPNTGDIPPYATYTVYVEHPSYVRAVFTAVPVFSGVESIQPVQMISKAMGTDEPEPIIIDEAQRNTL